MSTQTLSGNGVRSVLLAVGVVLCQSPRLTADPPALEPTGERIMTSGEAATLRFSFERAPWRSVLSWVADEAGLALYISELPTGSFTYSDPNLFTPSGTIDRINLFLIPQGYTFVRSGNILALISLNDPSSMKQLDAMAEFVSVDQLERRESYDVVKCFFPLGKADAASALSELNGVDLITEPVVLRGSNQLFITDTAGKLKIVKAILDSLDAPDRSNELVKSFVLEHAGAEEVLTVARAHLGIEAGEMSGFDISISADTKGQKLFVTGSAESIQVLESLIKLIDKPGTSIESRDMPVLRSHIVSDDNLRSVYDVLQTLLADQSIRLSEEVATNSIVALAPPRVHEQIKNTIAELDGPSLEFAVIDLKTLNPYFAITLLNELFGVRESLDPELENPDSPKIDADPQRKRLFVRGKPSQIEQIKRIVERLDSPPENRSNVRILPSYGAQSREILDTAKMFWRGENPVLLLPPAAGQPAQGLERTTHPDQPKGIDSNRELLRDTSPGGPPGASSDGPYLPSGRQSDTGPLRIRWVDSFPGRTTGHRGTPGTAPRQVPPLYVRLTPRGIVIQSVDSEALNRFEDHLRLIAGLGESPAVPPVVFYLKYATADEATRMLADLLDGTTWLGSSSGGTLVNGIVSPPTTRGFWGSLVLSREGTTTMTAGSATVVSDARLNRLIVQGTAQDISLIESYLKVIDKGSSITAVETHGRSHVIELFHTEAPEVAAVIREAYAGRIAGATSPQKSQRNAQQRAGGDDNSDQPKQQSEESKGRGEEGRRPASKPTRNRDPEMTVAVHEASNSLIITAPDQLFAEVEQLVRLVDKRAEQAVEVVIPHTLNARYVREVLQDVLLGRRDRERRSEPRAVREATDSRRNRENE